MASQLNDVVEAVRCLIILCFSSYLVPWYDLESRVFIPSPYIEEGTYPSPSMTDSQSFSNNSQIWHMALAALTEVEVEKIPDVRPLPCHLPHLSLSLAWIPVDLSP